MARGQSESGFAGCDCPRLPLYTQYFVFRSADKSPNSRLTQMYQKMPDTPRQNINPNLSDLITHVTHPHTQTRSALTLATTTPNTPHEPPPTGPEPFVAPFWLPLTLPPLVPFAPTAVAVAFTLTSPESENG